MPSILIKAGWRLFFYANEGNEPIHIHCQKGDMECKYWIITEEFEIREEFAFNLTPAAKREIRSIIYENFEYIIEEWSKFFKDKRK